MSSEGPVDRRHVPPPAHQGHGEGAGKTLARQAESQAPEATEHPHPFQGGFLPCLEAAGLRGLHSPLESAQPSGALQMGIISWGITLTSVRFLEDCPHCSDFS